MSKYRLKRKNDLWITGGGILLSGMGLWAMTSQPSPNPNASLALNRSNINSLDRSTAVFMPNKDIAILSDWLLDGSVAIAFIPAILPKAREDWKTIGIMGLETGLISTGMLFITKRISNRFRPYSYAQNLTDAERRSKEITRSFFSGHTSIAATWSFFGASVFSRYSESKWVKRLVWTAAVTLPALTGYARIRSGKHFLTDVLTGYAIGGLTGYIIPHIHKPLISEKTSHWQFGVSPSGSVAAIYRW